MNRADKLKYCASCTENFYNGNNPYGVSECWMLKKAKLVTRYKIGVWTTPTQTGAFSKVKTLNCHHSKGNAYTQTLPDYVKASDVLDFTKVSK